MSKHQEQEENVLEAFSGVINSVIGSISVDELINLLLRRLVAVMRADTAVILLKENDQLRVRASVGIEEALRAGYSVPLGVGFAGTIAGTLKPLYIEDAQTDPLVVNPFIKQRGIRTMLGIPLRHNGNFIGVLHVDWLKVHPYSEREVHLLEVAAEQHAIASLNVRLFDETKQVEGALRESLAQLAKKNRYQSIISSVARSIHQSLDLQDVLESAVDSMSKNVDGADNVAIFLVQGKDAVLKAYRGYPDWFIERIKKIPHPKGLTWQTILGGKSVSCSDVDQDTVIGLAGREVGTKSYMSMPIRSGDDTVGCLTINSLRRSAFSEEELGLLETVADHVETAIDNANQMEALRQSQEEISKLNRELEQRVIERTTQLEATIKELEAFSYSVSHDLRAPLRAIDGFSRILTEDYSDKLDQDAQDLIRVIRDNTKNMGQLIEDLLAFSRLGRQEMSRSLIEMDNLARAVLMDLEPATAGRSLEFKVDRLPLAFGDRAMIRQVFVNLLSNAIKFTRPKEAAVIEVGGRMDSGESTYYVKDNGAGFDMNYVHKLFRVFQRLHSQTEFEGTGAGLAIVQRIIKRHGGRVWAEGKEGEGAIFYFTLPGDEL